MYIYFVAFAGRSDVCVRESENEPVLLRSLPPRRYPPSENKPFESKPDASGLVSFHLVRDAVLREPG